MLPPPKKLWNRFASKVISKLSRLTKSRAITRNTQRLLDRYDSNDYGSGNLSSCCSCHCHFDTGNGQEHRLQLYRRFLNRVIGVEVEEADEDEDEDEYEYKYEDEDDKVHENGSKGIDIQEDLVVDHCVDAKAEEFIAKFHESLKLERELYS